MMVSPKIAIFRKIIPSSRTVAKWTAICDDSSAEKHLSRIAAKIRALRSTPNRSRWANCNQLVLRFTLIASTPSQPLADTIPASI